MKKLTALILFAQFAAAQQIPLDSISYEYFYENELEQIVLLKQKQRAKPFDAKVQYKIAELYDNINCEDSAYVAFYKVYVYEKNKGTFNDEEFKELLFQLHGVESSKHSYTRDRHSFLKELEVLSKDDEIDKWRSKVQKEIARGYFSDSLDYLLGYTKMLELQNTHFYANNIDFKTRVLLTLGNYCTSLDEFDKASNFLNQSYEIADRSDNHLLKTYVRINQGVNQIWQKKYNDALEYLNAIDKIPQTKYQIKINRIVHKQKARVYDSLGDIKNLEHQNLYIKKYDSLISDFSKNSNFYEIDVAYQTKQKDQKIKELSSLLESFNKNKLLYSMLLFLVFLLALYSFVRWKKATEIKNA